MEHFTAVIEVAKRGNMSADDVDRVMDRLAGYPVSLSTSPHGYQQARITLPADNIGQASTGALVAVANAFGIGMDKIVSLELMTESESENREGFAVVPELIGVTEAAELLSVSPQRVRQMIEEGKLGAHRVGDRAFALIRSEVESTAAVKELGGIPGLGKIIRELGLEPREVVATPHYSRSKVYTWRNEIGEEFEAEDAPPPDAIDVEERQVDRYQVRALGAHKGGIVQAPMDGVPTTTLFDITRYGDWKTSTA